MNTGRSRAVRSSTCWGLTPVPKTAALPWTSGPTMSATTISAITSSMYEPGRQYFNIGWDQTPHLLSTSAKTLFGGVGSTRLTVDTATRTFLQGQLGRRPIQTPGTAQRTLTSSSAAPARVWRRRIPRADVQHRTEDVARKIYRRLSQHDAG